jgi:hypothetical protein
MLPVYSNKVPSLALATTRWGVRHPQFPRSLSFSQGKSGHGITRQRSDTALREWMSLPLHELQRVLRSLRGLDKQ